MKLTAFISFTVVTLFVLALFPGPQFSPLTTQANQEDLKQCEYVLVTTKPFLCAEGELILVSKAKASKYCSKDGFSEQFEEKIYCQFNGVDSRLKLNRRDKT